MTHFLVATDSVHTTAAACDYLDDWLAEDDVVTVLTVDEPGSNPRDGVDALNVAGARLGGRTSVETITREGKPAEAILGLVAEAGIDVVIVGTRRGTPGAHADVGETCRAVIAGVDVPAVVVPLDDLDPGPTTGIDG